MNPDIIHNRNLAALCPFLPRCFYTVQCFRPCTNPCVIDVEPIRTSAEMQIHRRPVIQLRIVHACNTAPPRHIRQRLICCRYVFVFRNCNLLRAGTDAHSLCHEIPVLLRMLQPLPVFILHLCIELRKIRQGRVCHLPVFRMMHLCLIIQTADEGQKTVVRLTLKKNPAPSC